MEDLSPLFAHDEPGPRFTIKDLSRALGRFGVEYSTANARVAAYAKNRQIHVREKGAGATSPNKFGVSDLAAAAILSAIQDAGVADRGILARVSGGLYAWTPGVKATRPHPIRAALEESISDEAFWQLQIDFYRHLQTNQREMIVSFYRAGEIDPNVPMESDAMKRLRKEHPDAQVAPDPRTDENYWPTATLQIPATIHLMALKPFVEPAGN